MTRKKGNAQHYRISAAPLHEKLPWPGLRAEDHLSRVVTRAVKEAKEARETVAWAEKQIARILDHAPPEIVLTFIFNEMGRRRGKRTHGSPGSNPSASPPDRA